MHNRNCDVFAGSSTDNDLSCNITHLSAKCQQIVLIVSIGDHNKKITAPAVDGICSFSEFVQYVGKIPEITKLVDLNSVFYQVGVTSQMDLLEHNVVMVTLYFVSDF